MINFHASATSLEEKAEIGTSEVTFIGARAILFKEGLWQDICLFAFYSAIYKADLISNIRYALREEAGAP